jgi:predicted DNA-binding protein (MmcQ/YjbR family)
VNLKSLQSLARSLPAATQDIKWQDHLVFSVGKKMFASFHEPKCLPLGFKCSDLDFDRLVKRKGIIPAPYAARFGWVSIQEPKALPQREAQALIKKSYELVLAGLPKKLRAAIDGPDSQQPTGKKPRRTPRARPAR